MSKQVQDGLWRGVLLLLMLLPALQPLLQTDAMPCTHDSAFHYFRITTMKEGLKQGLVFSRWVPGLALGFGYPFFNYREPLPYWAGEALLVLGFPAPLALGLLYALSFLAAAYGMFVLARDLFNETAGWVSAVLYALAPYMLLDALRRGNMPEVWAFALLPWIFVAFRNLIMGKGRKWFVIATALLSALFLSHNISSLLLSPFLGAYVLLLSVIYKDRKAWPWAFAAVILTILLTAWFWMPALLEQDYVQLHLSTSTRNNDFHYNFVSWAEIFGFGTGLKYDPNYLNPPMTISFSLWLGLLGTPIALFHAWRWRSKEQRLTLLLMAVFTAVYLVLSTDSSVGIWERFDLLAFVQFPWRLVGRALFPMVLVVSAGAAEAKLHGSRKARAGWFVLIVLTLLFTFPQTFPPKGMCAAKPYPDLADVHAYERQGWLGMDPESSYFPVWVEDHQIVTTRPELAEAMQRGENPARMDVDAIPEGAQVLSATYKPVRAELEVVTPEAFTARWWGLYFPGWQVKIDGQPVEVVPEEDTGLMMFEVPEGQHTIKVWFGETPLRKLADGISVVGVLLLGGALWWFGRKSVMLPNADSPSPDQRVRWSPSPARGEGRRKTRTNNRRSRKPEQNDDDDSEFRTRGERFRMWMMPWRYPTAVERAEMERLAEAEVQETETPSVFDKLNQPWIIMLVLLVWLAVQWYILPSMDTALYGSRLNAEVLPEGITRARSGYNNGMALIGYDLESRVLEGDGELLVKLMWQATAIPQSEYRTSVLLMDAEGRQWSTAGTARPRGYEPTPPTTQWLPGQYAYDPHIIAALPGTPPGEYRVVVSIFDRYTLTPATVLDANGVPVSPTLDLGTLTVTRATEPATLKALGIPEDAEIAVCGDLGLWSTSLDRAEAAPGDVLSLHWVWEAIEKPVDTIMATVILADNPGDIKSWELAPVANAFPTSMWEKGDRWAATHVLRLPGNLESGAYHLDVSLPGCDGVLMTASLQVNAPERVFELPAGMQPPAQDVVFGKSVRLAGQNIVLTDMQRGSTLLVQLAWQAEAEMETSYLVYLHLLSPDGSIAAQNDGEPAGWTRPTTGWAVDEVIVEERSMVIPADAPAGDYSLRVGVYDAQSGRLVTADGEDGFVLIMFEVR